MTPGRAFFGLLAAALLALPVATAAAPAPVATIDIEGVINPVTLRLVGIAIDRAQAERAQALIIQLDTPGGLEKSMRAIVQRMLNSDVPMIIFVAPTGARAASAGVFITMAAHIAAMAPATNIGAASPVMIGGGNADKTMMKKIENDATAGRDAHDPRRPGDADRDRLPRPSPQRHHRPERRLRADDARDARPLLRALQPGRGPARSHRRDLADPRVLCLPEPADQLRGAPPDPVRDRLAGCRDQDREPWHSRDRRYRLDGARLAHAVRRPRDRPARVVVGDRAHGRRDGRALPVRRRGRGAGARAPPAPGPERPRGAAGDGQRSEERRVGKEC